MSKVRFACPGCNKEYQVGSDKAGRKTKCRECGTSITIPSPQVASRAVPEAKDDVAAPPTQPAAEPETMFNPFVPPQSNYEPNGQLESVGNFIAASILGVIVTGVAVPLAALIGAVLAFVTYMVLWSKIINIVGETAAVGIPVAIGACLVFFAVVSTSGYLANFFQKVARNRNPTLGATMGATGGLVSSIGMIAFLIKTGRDEEYETYAGILKFSISAAYVVLPIGAILAGAAGGYVGAAEPYCEKCKMYIQPRASRDWYGMDGETFRKAVEENDEQMLKTGKGEIEFPFIQLSHSKCLCGELFSLRISENQPTKHGAAAEVIVDHLYLGEKPEGLRLLLDTGVRD